MSVIFALREQEFHDIVERKEPEGPNRIMMSRHYHHWKPNDLSP
jgi:hypothetical protein